MVFRKTLGCDTQDAQIYYITSIGFLHLKFSKDVIFILLCRNRKCGIELPEGAIYCPQCGRKQVPEPRKRGKRPNGSGSIYSLQGKRARPWVAAKCGLIIGYYPTKADALKALELIAGKSLTEKYNMTFTEVYEEWKSEHFRELTLSGQQGYENAYLYFKPLHNCRFRDLRVKDYQPIIDSIFEAGKSSSLANKLKQLIGQMSKWAIREDIITTNYASFLKIETADKKEKVIFTDDEIDRIIADGSGAAKIVLMMIYTGVRIGEMFSIKLTDYHGTYCIGGEKTDAGKNRVIPIPPIARPYFDYFASSATTYLLDGFEGNKTPANFRKREFASLMKRLNIYGKTPHCTRHTYASYAVRAGTRPELLQKILGHADYSTTAEIYVHSDTEDLVSAANSIWDITNK